MNTETLNESSKISPAIISIRPVSQDDTVPLRMKYLRIGKPRSECFYEGDNLTNTYHSGAFLGARLVGICSAYNLSPPDDQPVDDLNYWRIRGIAVEDDIKTIKCSRLLVDDCIRYVLMSGADKIWGYTRASAKVFWIRRGFAFEPTEVETTGGLRSLGILTDSAMEKYREKFGIA